MLLRLGDSVFLALLALALGAGGCLDPTEIVLSIHTDLDCTSATVWKGVSIYTGSPDDDLETAAPTLTTAACGANGTIGSLVLVPSGSRSAKVGIQVVAGITQSPDACAGNGYEGCIRARLNVPFSPHQELHEDIALMSDCVGLVCDATHTCDNGVCVDANASTMTPPLTDGGTTAETVRCGDNGVRCPTSGDVCCLSVDQDAGTTHGDCRAAADCPSTSIVLACDDESDCSGRDDGGLPIVCCLSYTANTTREVPTSIAGTACLSFQQCTNNVQGLELCDHRMGCLDHTRECIQSDSAMPGYFWCTLIDP